MPDVATTVRRSAGRKVKVYGQFVRFTDDAVLFRVERIEGFDMKEPKEVWIPKSLTYMETGKPYIEVDYWKVRQLLGESLNEDEQVEAEPFKSQFFQDMKAIYVAHAQGEEPDRHTLLRVVEVLIPFMEEEVSRTRPLLGDKLDWVAEVAEEILPSFENVLSLLREGETTRELSIAVDQTISLGHIWGGVIDNIEILTPEETRPVFEELLTFLRSIGRFPKKIRPLDFVVRTPEGEDVIDYDAFGQAIRDQKNTWRVESLEEVEESTSVRDVEMIVSQLLEVRYPTSWGHIPWPVRQGVGEEPRMDRDRPPRLTPEHDYILYHGTSLLAAKEIVRTRTLLTDDFGTVGFGVRPEDVSTYGSMKAQQGGGAIVRFVVDKEWFLSQEITHEVGGHGRDQWLLRLKGIPLIGGEGRVGIPPEAIKRIKIVRAWGRDLPDEEMIDTESLTEDKQVDLDPDFFDDENRLRSDVRGVMLKLVNNVFENLDEKGFDVQPAGIWLTGSLCGPNWDEHSDVDLHVGIDYSRHGQPELMKQALSYFARNFNSNQYDLLNRSLELYFQDTTEPHRSPGVYDIENDHWHQPPDGVRIEVTEEMKRAATKYLEQVETLKAEYVETPRTEAESFMARLKTFWEGIKTMRKEGFEKEGRASFGNQVFKQLRRNNTLPTFVELISQVQDDIYEVTR